MRRGGSKPGARVARWGVLLAVRAPDAAVMPLKELPADVAKRVGETSWSLGAAGLDPERRPVPGSKVGPAGKMPNVRHFLAAVGSERARELVAVARCAVSQSLERLPVPMACDGAQNKGTSRSGIYLRYTRSNRGTKTRRAGQLSVKIGREAI